MAWFDNCAFTHGELKSVDAARAAGKNWLRYTDWVYREYSWPGIQGIQGIQTGTVRSR